MARSAGFRLRRISPRSCSVAQMPASGRDGLKRRAEQERECRAKETYDVTDDEPAPGVAMMTEVRGASNLKAKTVLGWRLRWPSWRQGFRRGMDAPIPSVRYMEESRR